MTLTGLLWCLGVSTVIILVAFIVYQHKDPLKAEETVGELDSMYKRVLRWIKSKFRRDRPETES